METPLKGSWFHPTLMESFKTFEDFYKWANPQYKGAKADFEKVYYQYHKKKGEE